MTEENTFLLVSGDFSGIQDTVYTISSKGALKSLRARSFMLELLTEHIVYEILQLAGIPTEKPEEYLIWKMLEFEEIKTGVIYSGGGAFSLLLPDRDNLKNEIETFAGILNDWALDEFAGKLFIAIHALKVSKTEIKDNFKEKRQQQAEALDKLKRRKFWTNDGELLKKLLTPEMPQQLNNEDECQITRRDDLPKSKMKKINEMWVSSLSYHLWHLGDKLTDLKEEKKIYRYNHTDSAGKAKDGSLCFPKHNGTDDALYSVKKISALIPEKSWTLGEDFYYAYYVRKVEHLSPYAQEAELKAIQENETDRTPEKIRDYTASFHGLAASSCGADLIGSLRMDVDNLGKLFSNINDYKQLAKLSHDLNYFFKAILNRICEGNFENIKEHFKENEFLLNEVPSQISENDNKKERTVSVIYAGGDDLFIVGAWNEVAELAFDIQKCFDQYCRKYEIKNNEGKFATISGGLTLHHPKFPLYQMAERSGRAENEAKTWDENKNRIALFYDEIKEHRHQRLKKKHKEDRYMLSMSWEAAHNYLLPLMDSFAELGEFKEQENGRNTFAMDKISYQTVEKWFLVTEKYQRSGELYLPTMARIMKDVQMNLNRQNMKDFQMDLNRQKKNILFCILMKCLYNNPKISHFHIALNWLSFLRRTR